MAENLPRAPFAAANGDPSRTAAVNGSTGEVEIPVVLIGGEGMAAEVLYAALVQRSFAVTLAVGHIKDAADEAVKSEADICMLFDEKQPDKDDVLRSIRMLAECGKKVLILNWESDVDEALAAGALEVVARSVGLRGLERKIRQVHARQIMIGPPDPQVPTPQEIWWLAAPFKYLTPRERDCLVMLYQGMSTHEIMEALEVSLGTVRTHIGNLLSKLNVHSRLEAVALVARYRDEG